MEDSLEQRHYTNEFAIRITYKVWNKTDELTEEFQLDENDSLFKWLKTLREQLK